MSFTDKAFAMLYVGHRIGAELPASSDDLRSWVSISTYVDDGTPWGASYRGVEPPSFHIHRFEARRSSLDAGYDLAGELVNEREADIHPKESIESTIKAVEEVLVSWSIDPSTLGPLDDDFPLP